MIVQATGNHQGSGGKGFSRRTFFARASCFGAFYAVAKTIPLAGLAETVSADSRVSATPLVDKGFASVRKIGNGLYATISDPSKGNTTLCNGGFLAGKDGALLIEGFTTPAGASFQMDVLRMVTQVPVKAALGHPLSLRSFDGECVLRSERRAGVGACDGRATYRGKLLSNAGRRKGRGAGAF